MYSFGCLLLLLLVSCASGQRYTADVDRPYIDTVITGHPLRIDGKLWEKNRVLVQNVLQILDYEVKAVIKELPQEAMAKIADVPIWLETETPNNAPIQYHYSRAWLLEHGYNPNKEAAIEIVAKDFVDFAKTSPFPLLAPLAAAYGHRLAVSKNQIVLAAFGNTVSNKLYKFKRADDYFVAISERYFSDVQHSEYKREKLRGLDSLGFEMVRTIWNIK
jgi:hypothetical protein